MASYTIDKSHSHVAFTVRHMVFAKVRGQFKDWEATLAYNESDPTKSTFSAKIAVASIDTQEEKRDGHLRSADFFETEKYPSMTFKSKRIEAAGSGEYKVTGDLSLHGVSKEITLDVEETGRGKDPWGNQRVGFSAKGVLNRTDFGLKWNQALETGGVLVGEKVDIAIDVEVIIGA